MKMHICQFAFFIKRHHYIISYDPADVTENGLTGERAQAISIELAKQMFPGYQALVVTHTDGHNESGNIHTHIVINSVRNMQWTDSLTWTNHLKIVLVTSTDPLINS